jgi:hypothetical protein
MMIRLIPAVLLLATQVAAGQVYFDGLYGDPVASGEGISTDGTVRVVDGYLSWAFVGTRKTPFMFQVGMAGDLTASYYFEKEDTVALWARNVIKLNDTLFAGGIWRQVETEPSAVRGDHGLAVFTLQGQVVSERYYGLPDRMEYPARVRRTPDGGFAFVGQVISGTESNDNGNVHLMKTDSAGNQLWEKEYGGTSDDMGRDVVGTPDGGFLIFGWTRSFGAGQRDFYLVKTDSLGNQQWQRTYGGSDMETGLCILNLSDGNYMLAGAQIIGGIDKGKLIKINAAGNVIWQNEYLYPNSSASEINKVIELDNGNIVGVGVADSPGEGNAGWLIKTDSEGAELWQRKYNKNQFTDLFYSVLLAEDGGFLLSGQAVNEETMSQDAWLLKVDSVGCAYPNCLVGIDELGTALAVADVWPNPATDFVNVEFLQSGMAEIQLYDMAGKLLLQRQSNQTREAVDVSSLQNGLYLLTVIQAASRATVRIVVQH